MPCQPTKGQGCILRKMFLNEPTLGVVIYKGFHQISDHSGVWPMVLSALLAVSANRAETGKLQFWS